MSDVFTINYDEKIIFIFNIVRFVRMACRKLLIWMEMIFFSFKIKNFNKYFKMNFWSSVASTVLCLWWNKECGVHSIKLICLHGSAEANCARRIDFMWLIAAYGDVKSSKKMSKISCIRSALVHRFKAKINWQMVSHFGLELMNDCYSFYII